MVWPAKLIYSVIASLDGYIEDAAGTFGWAAPDEAVHAFVNGLERPVGTYLHGRRMYETMVFWERAPDLAHGRRGRIVRQLGAAEVEVGDAVPVVDAHGRVACRIRKFRQLLAAPGLCPPNRRDPRTRFQVDCIASRARSTPLLFHHRC